MFSFEETNVHIIVRLPWHAPIGTSQRFEKKACTTKFGPKTLFCVQVTTAQLDTLSYQIICK
jgi:hypothetical protein